jgi:nucleoside-diphosphate-sugar epimerase
MKILITGATGYVGRAVAQLLVERGEAPTGLVRSNARKGALPDGVQALVGSLEDPSWLAAVDRFDAVVHTAFPRAADQVADAFAVEEDFLGMLTERLAGSDKTLIVSNGTIFLGESADARLDEDSAIVPGHPAARRGKTTHDIVALPGIRGIELRLASFVYGQGGGGFLALLLGAARKAGRSIYIGEGDVPASCVHVDAAARGYVDALMRPIPGSTYHLASDEEPTWRQIAQAVALATGAEAVSVSHEEAAATFDPFVAMFMSTGNRLSAKRARSVLDWSHAGYVPLLWDVAHGSYAR